MIRVVDDSGHRGGLPVEQWREELIDAHQPLVDRVLRTVWGRVPSRVGRDELRASGLLGLVQAASRFDPETDATFATFAEFRVRGAMLDCVRQWDNLPRRLVELDRRIAAAESGLRSAGSGAPTDAELADHLGEDVAAITTVREWRRSRVRSPVEELPTGEWNGAGSLVDPDSADEFDRVVDRQLLDQMTGALASLPPRLREVIEAIYFRGVPPGELAERLGVTPTRVSQLRSRALDLLQQSMTPPGLSASTQVATPGRRHPTRERWNRRTAPEVTQGMRLDEHGGATARRTRSRPRPRPRRRNRPTWLLPPHR